ncbi:MAG TPA: hypothetical protein ENI79_03140 [Rhodospirillales bacterium]|nr:hypothetical protein [Rhodospirillales bacterium]
MSGAAPKHLFLADAMEIVLTAAVELDPCDFDDRTQEILAHAEELVPLGLISAHTTDTATIETAINCAAHAVTFVAELIAANKPDQYPETAK